MLDMIHSSPILYITKRHQVVLSPYGSGIELASLVSNVSESVPVNSDGPTVFDDTYVATTIPNLSISDPVANSSYTCNFGISQELEFSDVEESQLYEMFYAGNLRYNQWGSNKANLKESSSLTIYEGLNDAGAIRFNFGSDSPAPVEPPEEFESASSNPVSQPFQNFPEESVGGISGRKPFDPNP